MRGTYDQKQVSHLVGISESQIRYWDKIGLIPHVRKENGTLFFDFKGLVAFRTMQGFLKKGLSVQRIRKGVEEIRSKQGVQYPLLELTIETAGKDIVVRRGNGKVTAAGQRLLNFGSPKLVPLSLPIDPIEELFFQALDYEEQGEWHQALLKYQVILERKPDYMEALVNMGNIAYWQGNRKEAAKSYRKVLYIDPDHLEGNYNYANILEEKGDLHNALLFYRKCIHIDPEFSDARFDAGSILDKIGEREEARKQWLIYLDLDPGGEEAEYVRKRLEEYD